LCTADCTAQNQVQGRAVVVGFPFPVPDAVRLKPRFFPGFALRSSADRRVPRAATFINTCMTEERWKDGPFPVVLLALTGVTGLVDAISFLGLGSIFTANMTGNVVLLGFAIGRKRLESPFLAP